MQAKPVASPTEARSTIDAEDVARFSRIADEWWDPLGKFKPLHRINPLRISYIRDAVLAHYARPHAAEPLKNLTLLDIGCGGGLIAEPMCRLGASVTAIDASEKNIAVATLHAEQSGLAIDYRASSAEALAESGTRFDVILALEIIEHVADVPLFLRAVTQLLAPGGILIMSTVNRTAKSYALAIIGAEYILRWLPRGTHQWKQFIRPSELVRGLAAEGLTTRDITGMNMHPLTHAWSLDPKDLSVNYLLSASK